MRIVMSEALRYFDVVKVGSHHYAEQFMDAGHRVFWLGAPYHALSAVRGWLGDSRHEEAWRNLSGPRTIRPGSFAYQPVTWLPYRDKPLLRRRVVMDHTLRFCLPPVVSTLRRLGFGEPDLLWLSQSPSSAAVRRLLPRAKMAYRISDRYAAFGRDRALYASAEEEIVRRAEYVFATARDLLDELPQDVRRRAHYLPNGADVEHFVRRGRAIPTDLAGVPEPRVIFAGTLGPWVDYERIAAVARRLPNVAFVFVGPLVDGVRLPVSEHNVHWLGVRRYDEIPALFEHCAVGWIPFRHDPLTESASPVKLFEYLAAGLPVVATPLREIVSTKAPIVYGDDVDAMVQGISDLLQAPGEPELRVSFAKRHDWRRRMELVASICGLGQ